MYRNKSGLIQTDATNVTRIIQSESLYYAPAGRYINNDSADRGRSIIQVTTNDIVVNSFFGVTNNRVCL